MDDNRANLETHIHAYFERAAHVKKSQLQVPVHGFGFKHFCSVYHTRLMCILSSILLICAIVLEWTEEYSGSIRKPVLVRWAGIGCKLVALVLGAWNWVATTKQVNLVLFWAKGIITAS